MNDERKPLDFSNFEPRETISSLHTTERRKIDKITTFPSREQSDDAQINIKASTATVNRFRIMAKQERYRLGEFLEVLMNAYEKT